MALEISEFAERVGDGFGGVDVLRRPGGSVHAPIAIGANARSAAFGANTRLLRVFASASCRILVYDVPGGADATVAVADGSDGLSEYFPAGEHVIGVAPGQKLAVIAAVSE